MADHTPVEIYRFVLAERAGRRRLSRSLGRTS
jgi:hypothetical protein